jgi:hypothetical protein
LERTAGAHLQATVDWNSQDNEEGPATCQPFSLDQLLFRH